jgi:hypothetical protein
MCVDCTSLNKACPKDPFPLPHIDQIVDSTSGCEILSFLDAYLGYHQIAMKESDQFATSFITLFDTYCYITMPFGLKMLAPPTSVACRSVLPIRLTRYGSPTSLGHRNPRSLST